MIGQTISHYKILEKLGEGGMGVVYKAHDTKLDRTVALKFLPQSMASTETEKNRFIFEAKAASSLDHPNVCTVYEIDETTEGELFISMAYYEGETLKERVEKGQLGIDETIEISVQLALGLQAAHAKGMAHRDIKSANIMLTKSGQTKIMDFGLAKLVGRTQLTKAGATVGTIAYMSPEQARGDTVDGRTDIWSLGVVLYEMLTGQTPFSSQYEQAIVYSILNVDPKPIVNFRSDLLPDLQQIIDKTLQKNPDDRYQSIGDMIMDLRRVKKESTEVSPMLLQSADALDPLLVQPHLDK
jgi:serine/threonine protein kinase